MAACSWTAFAFASLIPVCLASGVLEFHAISFSSNCRETFAWDKCDHYLAFCFDKATNKSPGIWSCAYKRQETDVYDNTNDITFGSNMKGVPNPIIVPIQNFSDPRVLLVMRSMDKDDTSGDEHVVTVSSILTLFPSSSRSRASYKKDTASRDGSTFVYEFMAYCDSNLYGPQCIVFCQAQNNTTGHYSCNLDTGAKVCHTGWEGPNCAADIDECSIKSNICHSPTALNPKICVNSAGSYSCVCPAGWKGSNCSQDIDECENNATNPCRNGGTCNNTVGSYSCNCPHNWIGSNCTDDVDECSSDLPARCTLNNTRCNNTQGGYSCVCVRGWKGENCTEDVNECLESNGPCKNGGTCENTLGSFKCYCPSNWTGDSCSDDVDECTSQLASLCEQNNTRCNNTKGGYSCICVQGWKGGNCTEDVDECLESKGLCENGGTCQNAVGSYRCKCPSGWTGPHCAEDLDECSSKLETPCASPNFKCENDLGNYSCACADGWKGRNCTEDVDECAASNATCKNGGNCTNSHGSFSCQCPENWIGRTCTEDVDECSATRRPFPCPSSNYKCLNSIGNYSCACAGGWTGDGCEDDVDECEESYVTCENNGSCVNFAGGYRCDCSPGWGGVSCALDIDECANKPCTVAGEQCVNLWGAYQCVCPEGSTVCGQTSISYNIQVENRSFLIWPIIVAVAALLVIVILIAIFIVCRRKRRREKTLLGRAPSHVEVDTFHSDIVMFENCLYHAGSRRLAETPVSDPAGGERNAESSASSFRVKGRTASTASNPSTRPPLPAPPTEGNSDYDTLHEEPVYHDIDDFASRRPQDWGDPQKDKDKLVGATNAYANGGVVHLDTRPLAGQKNLYEDFDSLQQAAAALKAPKVDSQGYMEPRVFRARSQQRERERLGQNLQARRPHDKPFIANTIRMNADGISNEGFDQDNKRDHNHHSDEVSENDGVQELGLEPQRGDPAEGSFTRKDDDGGQNIREREDHKAKENEWKRSGQGDQNENNKPTLARVSYDDFDGQEFDANHIPGGVINVRNQTQRKELPMENEQSPMYGTFGEDDENGNVEAKNTDYHIKADDNVDPERDPLQFITTETATTNGSVTIKPIGETADDEEGFDADRDDDDEDFPPPPPSDMWEYPLYEIPRKSAKPKAIF